MSKKRAIVCIVITFVVGVILGAINQFFLHIDSTLFAAILVAAAIMVFGAGIATNKKKEDQKD